MSKISVEYKETMEKEKQMIKKIGDRVVDAYETKDILGIVAITKYHIVWKYIYFKRNKKWDAHIMTIRH